MRSKQEEFVRLYTSVGTVTYHNASRAAIGAGYSESNARSQGHRNLQVPEVRAAIEEIRARMVEETSKTKEDAVREARKNYEGSVGHNEKKYWYDMWVNLQGWLVQKTENVNHNFTEEEAKEAHRRARDMLKELN